VLDSTFDDVRTGILMDQKPKNSEKQASVTLLNVQHRNVGTMVTAKTTGTTLRGGTGVIDAWFLGNTFSEARGEDPSSGLSNQKDAFLRGSARDALKPQIPDGLRYSGGESYGYYARSRPQYENVDQGLVPDAKGE